MGETKLDAFFADIKTRREQQLSSNQGKWPRSNPVASDISRCARETALGVLHWEDRPAFGLDMIARFEAGKEQENIAYAKMLRLGIEITEQQRLFELKDKKGRLLLRGKIDGKMNCGGKVGVPFDLKTMHPNLFDRFDTVEDLLMHPFFSKYPKQLMAYEYMNNIDIGFLWIDNMLGAWKFIEVPMQWNLMENILKQLETAVETIEVIKKAATGDVVVDALKEMELLPPYHFDPSYCLKCWAFKRVCTPPFFTGEGMKIINDPEFADKITRRAELDAAATEYDKLDKEIKGTLKEAMKPMDNWIIGDWLITAEEKERRMKAQPAKEAHTSKYLSFDIQPITEEDAIKKSSEDYEANLTKDV